MSEANCKPITSVIVPIYKVEQYICRCIDSLLAQTFTEYEVVLVDDGSLDNCGAISDEYLLSDDRLFAVHRTNGGLSAARNAGLELAAGKYDAFVDSDDWVESDWLEVVMSKVDEGGYPLVAWSYYYEYPECKKEQIFRMHGDIKVTDRKGFLINDLLTYGFGWEACMRLYKREIIQKYKIRFQDNRRIFAEDMCFCLSYCAHISKLFVFERPLYHYCIRENSIMTTGGKNLNIGRMNELSMEVYRHFSENPDCADLIKLYPAFHLRIIQNVLARSGIPFQNLYITIKEDVSNAKFFYRMFKRLTRHPVRYIMLVNDAHPFNTLSYYRYICNGSVLGYKMRNKIISWLNLNQFALRLKKSRRS